MAPREHRRPCLTVGGMVVLADQVMEMVLQAVVLVVTQVEVRLGRVEDHPGRPLLRRPPKTESLTRLRSLTGILTTVRIPQEGRPARDPVRSMRLMMTIIARR